MPLTTIIFRVLRKRLIFAYYCFNSFIQILPKDDCNWADHVGDLEQDFGVVGVRTPHGLTIEEFYHGLEKFRLARVDAEGTPGIKSSIE